MKEPNALEALVRLARRARDGLVLYDHRRKEEIGAERWVGVASEGLEGDVARLYARYSSAAVAAVLPPEYDRDLEGMTPSSYSLAVMPTSPRIAALVEEMLAVPGTSRFCDVVWVLKQPIPALRLVLDFSGGLKPKSAQRILDGWERLTPAEGAVLDRDPEARRFREVVAKPIYQRAAAWQAPSRGTRQRHRQSDAGRALGSCDVPLLRDDRQLRALIALRCVQQRYVEDKAYRVLRDYASTLRIPEQVIDDTLADAVRWFLDALPDGLPSYLRRLAQAHLAEEAPGTSPGQRSLLGVSEAAHELGVSRRAVYSWIRSGTALPTSRRPYLFRRGEVDRLKARIEVRGQKGALYQLVMKRRGLSYDAARIWVRRRQGKGASAEAILLEARGVGVPGAVAARGRGFIMKNGQPHAFCPL